MSPHTAPPDQRLRAARRQWASLFAGVTALVIVAAWLFYRVEAERLRDDVYQNLAIVGALKAGEIERWRLERQGDAEVTGRNPHVVSAVLSASGSAIEPAERVALRSALTPIADAYGYSDVLLVSPNDQVMFTLHPPAGAVGPNTHTAIDDAKAVSGAVVSNFFLGSDSIVHVDVTQAVRDAAGRVRAVLVLRTAADSYLYPLFRYWPTESRTGQTVMVRADGDMVVVLNANRRKKSDSIATLVAMSRTDVAAVRAVLGTRGPFAGPDGSGIPILADLREIKGAPWLLVTKVDEAEVAGMIWIKVRISAVMTVLCIALVGFLAGYGYRRRQAAVFRELLAEERAQREADAAFRTILYSIGDAIITSDAGGRVTAMNRVAEALTGWTDADARGRALSDVYRATEGSTLVHRDGSERPIASTTAPIVDDTGAAHGTVLVFRDQTAEQAQQASILQAERMASMGRIAGEVAHDFSNFLAAILNAVELAQAVPPAGPGAEELEIIRRTALRGATLTRQLLAFSRQQTIEPQLVDLNKLLADFRSMLDTLLGKRFTLAVGRANGAACVHADPSQLEQVVMNLALNARDAMPDGGTIAIETGFVESETPITMSSGRLAPGAYVTLVVRDSGCGMDQITASRIFEPFFTTKGIGKGTGLGLATVHGIVQQSGGAIGVTTARGGGSTFTVYLPHAR